MPLIDDGWLTFHDKSGKWVEDGEKKGSVSWALKGETQWCNLVFSLPLLQGSPLCHQSCLSALLFYAHVS